MRRLFITIGLTAAVVLAAVAGSGSVHAEAAATTVEVQAGDSLSAIAEAHETTYQRLFDANPNIANPNIIHPGDMVRIPSPDEQIASRPLPAVQAAVAAPAPVRATEARVSTPVASTAGSSVWDRLAACESSGNWHINTGNGYSGGLQISQSTWVAHGGTGTPAAASREQQIAIAERIQASAGWGAWPACSTKLGLR